MNKLLIVTSMMLLCAACGFHDKQPVDETYYKNTQGIAWPEKKVAPTNTATQTANTTADKTATVSKTITTTVSQTTTYTK